MFTYILGQCLCGGAWTGSNCEIAMCDVMECGIGSTRCVDGQCVCGTGFEGSLCNDLVCDRLVCNNNATCINGEVLNTYGT